MGEKLDCLFVYIVCNVVMLLVESKIKLQPVKASGGHQGSARANLGQLMKTGAIVAILLTKFKARKENWWLLQGPRAHLGAFCGAFIRIR